MHIMHKIVIISGYSGKKMKANIGAQKSFWWVSLLEFGEDVLAKKRRFSKLTQQDISQKCGLSQSEISRIERGLAKPRDIPTIKAVCDVYQLSKSEKERYLELTTGLINLKSQDDYSLIKELIESQIQFVSLTNRRGNPKIAIDQAELLVNWLDHSFEKTMKKDPYISQAISLLILEESAAWWDIVSPENIDLFTKQLIRRMKFLSPFAGNHYYLINQGFHFYIKGKYRKANQIFESILKNTKLVNTSWAIELIRANTISLGKLKNFSKLQNNQFLINQYLLQKDISNLNKAYLLEGLGRSYSEIKPELSLKILKKANKLLEIAREEPDFINIRFIQHRRSYLEALKRNFAAHNTLLEIASPALEIAEKHNFLRHRNQIIKILQ